MGLFGSLALEGLGKQDQAIKLGAQHPIGGWWALW